MLKSKKIITTLMLSSVLILGSVVSASALAQQAEPSHDTSYVSARTNMAGSDLWTRGLYKSTNPGWYMAYSYYKNGSYRPYVIASLNGQSYRNNGVIGYTVTQNNEQKSNQGFEVIAGTY